MNFKQMSQSDYSREQARASKKQLSPFARFCLDLKGYDLLRRGMPIDKFNVWWLNYRNVDYIFSGEGIITAVKKTDIN